VVDADVAVFSPVAVSAHALFLTPFFGAAVAGLNWIAVGRPERAARTVGIGAVVTVFAAIAALKFVPAYFGLALLFAVILYLDQSMLRKHWPELPTAGVLSNLMLAACFFAALSGAVVIVWLILILL